MIPFSCLIFKKNERSAISFRTPENMLSSVKLLPQSSRLGQASKGPSGPNPSIHPGRVFRTPYFRLNLTVRIRFPLRHRGRFPFR